MVAIQLLISWDPRTDPNWMPLHFQTTSRAIVYTGCAEIKLKVEVRGFRETYLQLSYLQLFRPTLLKKLKHAGGPETYLQLSYYES